MKRRSDSLLRKPQSLAYAHCPGITLSPIVLAECSFKVERTRPSEVNYMAGVI